MYEMTRRSLCSFGEACLVSWFACLVDMLLVCLFDDYLVGCLFGWLWLVVWLLGVWLVCLFSWLFGWLWLVGF